VPACSFFGKEEVIPDDPADKLYNEGLYLLNKQRDFKKAAKRFEEVDRQHPYSEWARKSLIMTAYTYYEGGMYDDCINSAKRYITLQSGQPGRRLCAVPDRCLLLRSDLRHLARPGPHREGDERARRGVAQISQHRICWPAKKKLEIARDQLAGKEMDTARYYQKKRDYIAAINRFKVVITQYQTTRHVEEALMRLTESYMSLGIIDEAQTAAAVLGHNFPDSPWYKDAYNLVKGGGLEPNENSASWISKAFKKVGLGFAQEPATDEKCPDQRGVQGPSPPLVERI